MSASAQFFLLHQQVSQMKTQIPSQKLKLEVAVTVAFALMRVHAVHASSDDVI